MVPGCGNMQPTAKNNGGRALRREEAKLVEAMTMFKFAHQRSGGLGGVRTEALVGGGGGAGRSPPAGHGAAQQEVTENYTGS